jgi:hypothetical protein
VLKLACLFHDIGKLETRAVGAGGRLTFYGHHTAGAPLTAAIGQRLRLSGRKVDLLGTLATIWTMVIFSQTAYRVTISQSDDRNWHFPLDKWRRNVIMVLRKEKGCSPASCGRAFFIG